MQDDPNAPSASRAPGPWLAVLLVACTAFVFWPVTRWIMEESLQRQQIRQAAILLVSAAALIAWQRRATLRVKADFDNPTLLLLACAYAAVALAAVLRAPLLMLPGMALGLAGGLRLLFGADGLGTFRPMIAGLAWLFGAILLFPLLDWPLRKLAGAEAAGLLSTLHLTPHLEILTGPEGPRLLLKTNGGSFVVATECNGFGLITSSALVALLAAGISRHRASVTAGFVAAGVAVGFLANLLRIVAITQLAPFFPGHYHAMHEIVGTLALWSGLGLAGWLAWRPEPPPPAA